MAQIVFNIEDDKIEDVVNTLATHFNYNFKRHQTTSAAFVKTEIIKIIKSHYVRGKTEELEEPQAPDIT